METKTPTKLEQLLPVKELIVHSGTGLDTVFDTNAHLRAEVKNLFRKIVIEAMEEATTTPEILEVLRIKIGEL